MGWDGIFVLHRIENIACGDVYIFILFFFFVQ